MQRLQSSRYRTLMAATAVVALFGSISGAFAYPEPHRVPIRWELKFEPGELRLYVDRDAQPGDPTAYWYFTYKAVNKTGQDRFFAPGVTLYTDAGEIMRSGDGVPPQVENELIELLGNEFMERQNRVIGKIFVGEVNAIESLAVWPADDLDVTELSVFFGGLSGETISVTNPVTGNREVLQKTLQRDYLIPGSALARGDDPIDLVNETWVMR